MSKNFLNPGGHQNPISGSKVKAVLLKGWNLPIGKASVGRVCVCSLRSRLVSQWISERRRGLWSSPLLCQGLLISIFNVPNGAERNQEGWRLLVEERSANIGKLGSHFFWSVLMIFVLRK